MTTPYHAYAPNGKRIIGTLEEIQGCAYAEFYTLGEDGKPSPEYQGETKVYWDGQVPVVRDDQLVFLDQNGSEWLESQITFVPAPQPQMPAPTAEQLCTAYGKWGQHPDHSASDWAAEAGNNETRLGYWEWVSLKLETVAEEVETDA